MSNYVVIDLNDEKSKHLSEVLTNDTCKKILLFMSEIDEVTESDISKSLNIPLNTINYNMKKLLAASLVDESEKRLWSQKGKKIRIYTISNKSILISPKPKSKINKTLTSIITLGSTVIIGTLIRFVFHRQIAPIENKLYNVGGVAVANTQKTLLENSAQNISYISSFLSSIPAWAWFLSGGIFAFVIVLILNWKKL